MTDLVTFSNRGSMPTAPPSTFDTGLPTEAYDEARAAAPGWDIYHLEQQWREWLGENEIEPKFPARHFVKFCRTWYEKRGPAR